MSKKSFCLMPMALILLSLHCVSIAAEKIIVVTEEYPPYNYSENGHIKGYSVQLARELLRHANLEYDIQIYPWARAYQMAQTQANVLILTIVRQAERESQFYWLGPIAKRKAYLYKLASRKDIRVKSIEDVKSYMVGVNKADISEQVLTHQGFIPGKNIDVSPADFSNIKKLVLGRVDFVIGTELSISYLCKMADMRLQELERTLLLADQGDYYLAISKSSSPLAIKKLRSAFLQMKQDGMLKKIETRYLLTADN